MELMDALMTLRAIRRYTDEPVTEDEILTCIKAANQAPSGGNIQPWQFLVIADAEKKRAIGELYLKAWNRYEPLVLKALRPPRDEEEKGRMDRILNSSRHLAKHIGEAPGLVAFLMPHITMTMEDEQGPLDTGTPYASVFPAVQNFMLAARDLGIGTTLTTLVRLYQDEFRALCDVPDRFELVALVPMGRPKGKFGVASRRPPEAVTHWDTFGNERR